MNTYENGLNPITNDLKRKSSQTGPLIHMQWMGQPAWTPRNYASFAKEGYMENAIVYRCIRLIADAALSIPMVVYDDEDEPVDDHPFYDLLEMPNPFEGKAEIIDALYTFLLIAGNSYVEAVSLGGTIKELYILRPDRVKVALDAKGRPASYVYEVQGSKIEFRVPTSGQREVNHIKTLNPLNDIYGMSAIEAAAYSVDVWTEAGRYNKSLLQNQAKPSGALIMIPDKDGDASLTEEQFHRLKVQMEEKYQGTQNAGRPLLLEGGMDWKPMGMTPQDMEFINGKNQAAREIALALGVPPMLLGIPGDNTYSNYKEANVAFYRQTVLPLVTRVCQSLTVWLKPTYGDDFCLGFDQNEIAGLSQEREDTWTRVNASTVLTIDEKREALGYEEVDGGDALLVPSSLVPLDMALEPEPAVDPITGDPNADPKKPDPTEEDDAGA